MIVDELGNRPKTALEWALLFAKKNPWANPVAIAFCAACAKDLFEGESSCA